MQITIKPEHAKKAGPYGDCNNCLLAQALMDSELAPNFVACGSCTIHMANKQASYSINIPEDLRRFINQSYDDFGSNYATVKEERTFTLGPIISYEG